MSDASSGPKPFDASFAPHQRYAPTKAEELCAVLVERSVCAGMIIGHNGPRVHVRFQQDGATFVRWFDADQVIADPPSEQASANADAAED